MEAVDFARRFGGVSRLYGEAGLQKLAKSHVCVIGIGGVGSWAAEALARNAVGKVTLIDLDNIAESNVNRQIHALGNAFGKAKVTAMAERIRQINPLAEVIEIEDFVTAENAAQMLSQGYDLVLDAIDDAKAKVAITAWCRQNKMPLITTAGAGGRLDPTKIKTADMSKATGDRLLAEYAISCVEIMAFLKAINPSSVCRRCILMSKSSNPLPAVTLMLVSQGLIALAMAPRWLCHFRVCRCAMCIEPAAKKLVFEAWPHNSKVINPIFPASLV